MESALLMLVDKGANQECPDRVLVSLAGVVGYLAMSEFVMSMSPFGVHISHKQYKERAISCSADWLVSRSWLSRPVFWNPDWSTQDKAESLLNRLLEEYFPPKSEATPA